MYMFISSIVKFIYTQCIYSTSQPHIDNTNPTESPNGNSLQ